MRLGIFVFTGKSYLNPNSSHVKSSQQGWDKGGPSKIWAELQNKKTARKNSAPLDF
jgi:hypothetical protein